MICEYLRDYGEFLGGYVAGSGEEVEQDGQSVIR